MLITLGYQDSTDDKLIEFANSLVSTLNTMKNENTVSFNAFMLNLTIDEILILKNTGISTDLQNSNTRVINTTCKRTIPVEKKDNFTYQEVIDNAQLEYITTKEIDQDGLRQDVIHSISVETNYNNNTNTANIKKVTYLVKKYIENNLELDCKDYTYCFIYQNNTLTLTAIRTKDNWMLNNLDSKLKDKGLLRQDNKLLDFSNYHHLAIGEAFVTIFKDYKEYPHRKYSKE